MYYMQMGGTIEGYFNTWKKSDREFDTIEELEEYILQNY